MIDSSAVHSGRNADLGTWRDDRYVRCAKCGYPCHLDREQRAPDGSRIGYGIDLSSTTFNTTGIGLMSGTERWGMFGWGTIAFPSTNSVRIDPVVTAGCPMCGTYLYDK